MTMRMRITNDEPTGGYTARVRFFTPVLDGPDNEDTAAQVILAPGESTEAWIHMGRFIQVQEVGREAPATDTAPATEGA